MVNIILPNICGSVFYAWNLVLCVKAFCAGLRCPGALPPISHLDNDNEGGGFGGNWSLFQRCKEGSAYGYISPPRSASSFTGNVEYN